MSTGGRPEFNATGRQTEHVQPLPIIVTPETANSFGYGKLAGIPVPVWITMVSVGFMYVLMNWTPIGRYLYAIGGNVRAAELSGINTRVYIFSAYVLSSACTEIAALMLTVRLS